MFEVGDYAIATKEIRRVDNRSVVHIGERVKITDVFNGKNSTIVSIQPCKGGLGMIDICCDHTGPLKRS
jgi:hypothetical protein